MAGYTYDMEQYMTAALEALQEDTNRIDAIGLEGFWEDLGQHFADVANYVNRRAELRSEDTEQDDQQEALEGFWNDVGDSFRRALVPVTKSLVRPFENLLRATGLWTNGKPKTISYGTVDKAFSRGNLIFVDIRDMVVPCAYGQLVDNEVAIVRMVERYAKISVFFKEYFPQMLKFYKGLARHPESLSAMVPPAIPAVPFDINDEISQDIKIFDPASRIERKPFGDIYPNITFYGKSLEDVNGLVDKVWRELSPKTVLKSVNEFSQLIDALIEAHKEDFSKGAKDSIGKHVMEIAHIVEWYAICIHSLVGFVNTNRETVRLLEKEIK